MKETKLRKLEKCLKDQYPLVESGQDDSNWINSVMNQIQSSDIVEEKSWISVLDIRILWRFAGMAASIAMLLVVLSIFIHQPESELISETMQYDPVALLTLSLFGL